MIQAIIFDLDGVIVSTDEFHYQAWKRLADEEGLSFDREINERLRGVSRMDSLNIILSGSMGRWSEEKKSELAERKNTYYCDLLAGLTIDHMLPGVSEILDALDSLRIRKAIGSSSKNAKTILQKLQLLERFDVIVDGTDIIRTKPDPQVFLLAAKRLGVSSESCVVVEDAEAGIMAAIAAGMKTIGVGSAARDPRANFTADDLASINMRTLLQDLGHKERV